MEMIYPDNVTYQKATVCNRYIELFRHEHNTRHEKVVANDLRAELDALMPEAYHTCRILWLAINWRRVLNGQLNPDYPLASDDEYLVAPISEEDRAIVTAKKDEALQAWREFAKWQREEHGPTVSMLIDERHKAMEECRQDEAHNPTLSDFSVVNGKRKLSVPAMNPHNEATSMAFAMRAFETMPDMDNEHREAVFEAIAESRQYTRNSDFWDKKLDKELVRTNINLPEPPDPLEDFTTYTEVDGGSDNVTIVDATQIDFTDLSRVEETYVYKDFNVGHFGDFEHLPSAKITARNTLGRAIVYVLANIVDDGLAVRNDDGISLQFLHATGPSQNQLYLQHFASGSATNDFFQPWVVGTRYWFTLSRSGSTITCKIYDDVDRTNLLDTLSVLGDATTYRYYYPLSTFNSGTSGASITGSIYATDLQEAAAFQVAWARNSNQLIGVSQ